MTSKLTILNKQIRQFDRLYCLNDLHKASGGESRHQVSNWLKLQQTNELIEELSKHGITGLEQNQNVIHVIHGGLNRGTYACRELVLAYATWISPRFFLLVLRTFDEVSKGQFVPTAPACSGSLNPLPNPPRSLDEANMLFSKISELEKKITDDYHNAIFAKRELNQLLNHTKPWREYWQQFDEFADF